MQITAEYCELAARENIKPPKRCYQLKINVGGDTWEDVIWQLKDLVDHVIDHGPECQMVSGGCNAGWNIEVEHRPDMTNAKYFEALGNWRAHEGTR